MSGETLIKTAARGMAEVTAGDKANKATAYVPVLSNTVHCRTTDVAGNVKQQLVLRTRPCAARR